MVVWLNIKEKAGLHFLRRKRGFVNRFLQVMECRFFGGGKKKQYLCIVEVKEGMRLEEVEKNAMHWQYMRRCLQLARNGMQNARPNPMVGAVIVAGDGRIIGEGYHQRCGKGH